MSSEGDAGSIVLIHGQPGSGQDWAPLTVRLGDRYTVLAPDRPGWGANPAPATGMLENAAWLAGVMEAASMDSPATVVGHSLGGGIALGLALCRPDLVGSLVLLGSVGVAAAVTPFDRVLAVPRLSHLIIRAGAASVRRSREVAKRLSSVPVTGRLTGRLGASPTMRGLAWLDDQPVTVRARESFIVEQAALLVETPWIEERLATIKVPTMVVHSSLDRIVGRLASRQLVNLIPGAEWVLVPGEGHLVPIERPQLVAPLIERYTRLYRP